MVAARGRVPQLWGFVIAEGWRRARQRLRTGPLYRWRFSGRAPDRVLIAPPDLRLADPQIATEIYHGRFVLGGHVVETHGISPFQIDAAPPEWVRSLHGFRWLRHMRAAGSELAAANARSLVGDWIATHGRRIGGVAWQPDMTARRIIAWLQHSPAVLQNADYGSYRAFLKSLSIQMRYLRIIAGDMHDGEEKLRARIALAFACLSLPVSAASLRAATRNLAAELDRQVLPDGGHVSRNPEAVLELLADLLPLRQTYANQAEAAPEALLGAVERMLPALRFFRHRDGTLARFNGMGPTIHDRIAAVLHHDDTGGAPLLHASHTGYHRLAMGTTTVIADTGAPPPPALSHQAQAGCLSFEFSSGRHHYVVNCGIDSSGADDLRPLARATAAHSALTINDTSSARFSLSRRLGRFIGSPLLDGPRRVNSERIDSQGAQSFIANHDAYLHRFGLYHEREMVLSGEGAMLEGIDRVFRASGEAAEPGAKALVTVRFHIHPDTQLYRDEKGRYVLAAAGAHAWEFSCAELEPQVEESLFFAGIAGPRRSRQLVLSYDAADHPEIHWRFMRL